MVDIGTALAAVTASVGLTAAGFYWIGQTLMQHQLARFLEARKVDLAKERTLSCCFLQNFS